MTEKEDIQTSPVNKLRSRIMADGYRYEYEMLDEQDPEGRLDHTNRRKEKRSFCILYVLLCILVLAVILLSTFIIWQQLDQSKICNTAQCVENAGSMIAMMNLSVDPCYDFYEYACGQWIDEVVIPPENSGYDMFYKVRDKNIFLIQQLLTEDKNQLKAEAVDKAKLFYQNCMNTEQIEKLGKEPVLKLIKSLGSWTVTSDNISEVWNANTWDLTTAIATTAQYSVSSLFGFLVGQDDKDSTVNIIQMKQAGLTLSNRDEYLKNSSKYKEAFLNFAIKFSLLLGANDTTVKQKMTDVYELEKSLAEIFIPKEELIDDNKTYNKMTVQDLDNMLQDQIDIKRYLTIATNTTIESTTEILVSTPGYFKKLALLLAKTEKEVLANYVVWSMINILPGYLPQPFLMSALELNKVQTGIKDLGPRWHRCVSKVEGQLGFVVSSLFVTETFSKESRADVEKILNSIKEALIDDIEDIAWMDDETKNKAIDKAYAVTNMIAFPDWILNAKKLNEYYQKAPIIKDQFLQNFLDIRKFGHFKSMERLHKKPDPSEWGMFPHEVNAYYSPQNNHIVFPAGILQPPFYNRLMPRPVRYGSIGMIIGHELTHGFDSQGRKFDKHGNLYNWWTNDSVAQFEEKSKCIEEQYSNFKVQDEHLNGQYTLTENIADNGGLKFSHMAYKSTQTVKEQGLPGLDLSPDQLFFLGFAQSWCSKPRPQIEKMKILTDVHSLKRFRIHGTVSNSKSFARAFKCPSGSPMNPEKKCSVW